MKISELKEKMEKEHGKTIEEIAATVPLKDLTVEEFVVIQVLINQNHCQALDFHGELLSQIMDCFAGEEDEETAKMYG